MIKFLSNTIMNYLTNHDIIQKDFEIYNFGISLLIPYLIECFIIVLISFYLETLLESVTYIFLFGKLRDYCGGYHANSYSKCAFIFIFLFFICIMINYYIQMELLICLYTGSVIGLIICCPVQHPNKPLYNKNIQQKKIKMMIIIILITIFSIIIRPYSLNITKSIYSTTLIVFYLAVLQAIINLERRRKNEAK